MRVSVRVQPGASRTAVGGRRGGALLVVVTAPAVDGRATEAALRAIAAALGVRPAQVRLVRGQRTREKLVEVPDDAVVAARLAELLG